MQEHYSSSVSNGKSLKHRNSSRSLSTRTTSSISWHNFKLFYIKSALASCLPHGTVSLISLYLKTMKKNLLMLQMASFSNSVLTYFKHINTEAQQKVYHLPFDKNTATRTLTISLISLHKKVKKILTVLQTILLTLLNRFFFPPFYVIINSKCLKKNSLNVTMEMFQVTNLF